LLLGRGFLLKKKEFFYLLKRNGVPEPFFILQKNIVVKFVRFEGSRLDKRSKRNYFSHTVLFKAEQGENR